MSRYKVQGTWDITTADREPYFHFHDDDGTETVVVIQCADIIDTQGGREYRQGAFRVAKVTGREGEPHRLADFKPFKTGKGGTIPHYGESAWSAANRDFDDYTINLRYAR